jgi:hypothetical protein
MLMIFLISGTHLISAINPSIEYPRFNYTVNGNYTEETSLILFPGNKSSACYVTDIMYLITIGLCGIIGFSILVAWLINILIAAINKTDGDRELLKRNSEWFHKRRFLVFFGPLFSVPLIQLFGNIHYSIYSSAGIIPPENSFWMYNGYSFLAGPAGLAVIALAIGFCFLFFLIFKGVYWLIVKENRQIEVISPNLENV